jgi:hypothetical protein
MMLSSRKIRRDAKDFASPTKFSNKRKYSDTHHGEDLMTKRTPPMPDLDSRLRLARLHCGVTIITAYAAASFEDATKPGFLYGVYHRGTLKSVDSLWEFHRSS